MRKVFTTVSLGTMALVSMELGLFAVPAGGVSPAVSHALNGEVALTERRSGFDGSPEMVKRNVFWPVGWEPGQVAAVEPPRVAPNPVELFTISSILLGPPDLAVINGKRYETGDAVSAKLGENQYTFTILRIEDGAIVMKEGEDEYVVPKLRREAGTVK